jgi:hypothetical protein
MSPPLNYLPVYIGLFAIEMLALICNCFLDIRYGSFPKEVVFWFLGIAYSLRVGQRQADVAKGYGNKIKNRFLILSLFLFLFLFLPMWGLSRAGVYFSGLLLIAYNCTMTTARHLYLGVLISLILVIFASSHYRADWAMLFYIIPYVIAVVFTLVAEQINRKAKDADLYSLNRHLIGAQSYAIGAACLMILTMGLFLYLITPQVIWTSFSSQWGSPAIIGAQGRNGEGNSEAAESNNGSLQNSSTNSIKTSRNSWPTPAEMRNISRRQGMPEWQSNTIKGIANALEAYDENFKPILSNFNEWWQTLKEWLRKNLQNIILTLFALMLVVLIFGFRVFLREVKATLWLVSRWDYLRLGILAVHDSGNLGTIQYYKATERLFSLYDMERSKFNNTQEYLQQISTMRKGMKRQFSELTVLFEDSRYGSQMNTAYKIMRMRSLYCNIYKCIDS